MKIIELTRGLFTIVDDTDYPILMVHKWCAQICNGKFYAARKDGQGAQIYMHRQIMNNPQNRVDHKNRLTLDNRKLNLRLCTQQQNTWNNMPKNVGVSGYIGVSPNKDKFRAYYKHNRKQVTIGTFDTPEEAARVRDARIIEVRGDFSVLNFPDGEKRKMAQDIVQP